MQRPDLRVEIKTANASTPKEMLNCVSVFNSHNMRIHDRSPAQASICSFWKGGGEKKGKRKKVARCQNATPQIEQQVASDTLITHFPLFSVKTELDAREMGVKWADLPGNSATGSRFPRQTEGLRAIWTFWLAPYIESAGRRDAHRHGLLEETRGIRYSEESEEAGGGETDTNIQTQLTGRLAHTPE